MDRTRERGRIGVRHRGQATEFRGTVQDAVEAAEFGFDPAREFGMVVGRGAFQIQRIQQCVATAGHDLVVQAIEFRRPAPKQHHGRPCAGDGQRRGGAEAAMGTGDQHDPAVQHTPGHGAGCGARRRCAHAFCVSATMRASSPDSCNSSAMSQPPISSPWMNSCGNVGQLE